MIENKVGNPTSEETLKFMLLLYENKIGILIRKSFLNTCHGFPWYTFKSNIIYIFKNFLEDTSPFCWATDTPVLDFL